MVVKVFHKTRKDGTNLFRHFDALVDEEGKLVTDNEGNYIPSGFKIQKIVVSWDGKRYEKDILYNDAIDVENAPYEYIPTEIPIEDSGR